MSKIIYACWRDRQSTLFPSAIINQLSKRLEPDIISYELPEILESPGLTAAIFNPNEAIKIHRTSVCLGVMTTYDDNWWQPGNRMQDGSYALYRSNQDSIEVLTDAVASRTIWYYFDDHLFIASSSQRAIIFFLNSFEFNPNVVPWMLAAGILGPDQSWDKRLQILPGDTSLSLDRNTWSISKTTSKCLFSPIQRSEDEHEKELERALCDTFESLKIDYTNWVLPLSGGYDSRAILCMLRNVKNLRCVTWGLKESQYEKGNDAFVAKALADHFGRKHSYLTTNISTEPIKDIFSRFLLCGEGRIDHIAGYMDGFDIWGKFYDAGICGIIRGDVAFGSEHVSSELDVKTFHSFNLFSELMSCDKGYLLGINKQIFPQFLKLQKSESLATWRDRLFQQYRGPYFLAALNDLKLPFVEVGNPLLTKRILSVVRGMPDGLRTDKRLFKKIVNRIGPSHLGYARYRAIDNQENILRTREVVAEIGKELNADYAKDILPNDFLTFVLAHVKVADDKYGKKKGELSKLFLRVSNKLKKIYHVDEIPSLDPNVLAFRCYLICRMHRILNEDAKIIH